MYGNKYWCFLKTLLHEGNIWHLENGTINIVLVIRKLTFFTFVEHWNGNFILTRLMRFLYEQNEDQLEKQVKFYDAIISKLCLQFWELQLRDWC